MQKNMALILANLVMFTTGVVFAADDKSQGVNFAEMKTWDIVVAEDASPSERYAAEEFQTFFSQASGIKPAIVSKIDRQDYHIFIGPGALMEASDIGFSTAKFGPEDLRIRISSNNIAIAGGRPRGTLYGVYTFLEDYVGVRFLAPDDTYVPKLTSDRLVGPVDRFYHPPLSFRWSYYYETNADAVFAARQRCNALSDDPKLGGRTPISVINHTFNVYMPSNRYGKDHPEYYSLVKGKRLAPFKEDSFKTQLCLTNPDVLKIVTKAVLDKISAHPERKNISVSQNDNYNYCQCEKCMAINKREGSPMGSLLTFVNSVADEVSKKYPDVYVGTLAYQYSRKAPKYLKPRPNVQIQLCSIECCMLHPIDDPKCPQNRAFCRDLAEWSKICSNISIWNYNTNFSNYQLPCPNLRVIEPNIRYFVANNAKGIFMQAVYTTPAGEFSDLRNYITGKLLWDPNLSYEQLLKEFLMLHYGKAAEPIGRYINFVHDYTSKAGVHANCFGPARKFAIDEKVVRMGLETFRQAMELAENYTIRGRVEKASICAYRAAIEPAWITLMPAWITNLQLSKAQIEELRPMAKKFFELCQKYGVKETAEGEPIDKQEVTVKRALGIQP